MRVIHSLAWYFPESKAGTETYVSQLIRELGKLGVDGAVVAGRDGVESDSYVHEGIEVFRYPVDSSPQFDQIRGRRPYGGFEVFSEWLKNQHADIYHQHSVDGGCSNYHLRHAKSLGLPTIVTLHMPNSICLRGTMMLRGETACDGEIRVGRCGSCWGMSRGIPNTVASFVSRIPVAWSQRAERLHLPVFSALATSALVKEHKKRLEELSVLADSIVVISKWMYDALRLNGISEDQLVLCHSGGPTNGDLFSKRLDPSPCLRVGFLGRWAKEKGLHVLVEAVKGLPASVAIQLDVYALGDDNEAEYQASVVRNASGDSRISFKNALEANDVLKTLKNLDLLAIPSQCMETGPLVALEAQAAGIPIIASDLGGLSERVRHEKDGLLMPHGDVEAWRKALMRLAHDRQFLNKLRNGIRPIRTMTDVASTMTSLYSRLLAEKRVRNTATVATALSSAIAKS